MQTTENGSKNKRGEQVRPNAKLTPSVESGETSIVATPSASAALSKDLAVSLMGLIQKVNEPGVTPETVNASCNAAAQIYKILRLNFEMKKEGF